MNLEELLRRGMVERGSDMVIIARTPEGRYQASVKQKGFSGMRVMQGDEPGDALWNSLVEWPEEFRGQPAFGAKPPRNNEDLV